MRVSAMIVKTMETIAMDPIQTSHYALFVELLEDIMNVFF